MHFDNDTGETKSQNHLSLAFSHAFRQATIPIFTIPGPLTGPEQVFLLRELLFEYILTLHLPKRIELYNYKNMGFQWSTFRKARLPVRKMLRHWIYCSIISPVVLYFRQNIKRGFGIQLKTITSEFDFESSSKSFKCLLSPSCFVVKYTFQEVHCYFMLEVETPKKLDLLLW